jgi:hypothetical protein
MSYAPLLCRVACVQATLRPHVSVLAREAAPAQSFSQALRAAVVCGVPARPCARCAHRVCRLRAPPRFALRVRARRHTLPVRPTGAPLKSKAKPQALPSMGIFSTNAVKVPVLIALCVFNESAGRHAVQG